MTEYADWRVTFYDPPDELWGELWESCRYCEAEQPVSPHFPLRHNPGCPVLNEPGDA